MAKVLSSISGNLISAASAGYAPTNGADVSAIASAYQVVSATGTQLYAGTAYVTSLNSAPVSAERAGNAANAALANSAWYDGTGRFISALPDSATVSAIASSYAKSSVSGMSGNSSNWNSVYNTVSSNSANWSGGSQALTSPSGTIVINGDQLEGTNSAVLTETTGGQDTLVGTTTNTIQGYQMTALTNFMLDRTGYELHISSLTQQYGTEVLISGWTQNGTYESASGAFPANGTLVKIPLGNIISDISASANNWINMPGYEVTARLPGTIIVTGVGELAWASSVSGVSATVHNNSANWAASGISSATCSSIASSYAESAASNKLDESAFSSVSGTFLTAVPAGYATTGDVESAVSGKQDSSAMSAYALSADVSGVIDTVSSNSASWSGGATGNYVESSALNTAWVLTATAVSVSTITSISGKPLVPTYLQHHTIQVTTANKSTFYYMPSASPWTTSDVATGVYAPLQYATGACLAMNSEYFKGYFKGNEWFVSNTSNVGMLRGEVHKTRGIRLVGSSYNSSEGFVVHPSGVNGVRGTNASWEIASTGVSGLTGADTWQYGTAEYNKLTSVHDTVSANSATWASASAMSAYATTAYVESGLSGKENVFSAGTGLEFVQSGSDRVLQVEAPVDIVAGPGIVIDNPDGNTLRVSTDENYETVLWEGSLALNNDTGTLSEAIENFQSVAIYAQSVYGGGYRKFVYMANHQVPQYRLSTVSLDGASIYQVFFSLNITGAQVTVTRSKKVTIQYSNNSITCSDQTSPSSIISYVTKVVGIHRIAGGN